MKLSQLKEEIKGIIRERGVASIQKEYQKTIEEIEKALDFYKKNKNTDKKDVFVKVLKQLGEKKKALQNELDLKVQSMYRNAELKADESVNEEKPGLWANIRAKQARGEKPAHGNSQAHKDAVKAGKEINKNEEVVNEISAIDGLTDVIGGKTSSIEGVKLSKDMAEHIMYWVRTSPYGKKYGTWFKRNGIAKLLPIAFMWGLHRYLPSNLKSEFETLKSKYGKAKNESINEASFQKGENYGGSSCKGGCFTGKDGLAKIIKISKENPKNTFILKDDNYSGLKPYFIKNGIVALAKTPGNPSYDLDRNKVRNLTIGKDVILLFRVVE